MKDHDLFKHILGLGLAVVVWPMIIVADLGFGFFAIRGTRNELGGQDSYSGTEKDNLSWRGNVGSGTIGSGMLPMGDKDDLKKYED